MILGIIGYTIFGVMGILFLYFVCVRPTPITPDSMDRLVLDALDKPMELDPDGVFDRSFHDAGLCTAVDCEAVIDEDYPT